MNDWTNAEQRAERAFRLYEEGRWAEAAGELQTAIDINPFNPAWHFNLALTLEAMEQFDLAGAAFSEALELAGDDVEILNCLGVNMTRRALYADALEYFERIDRLDPDFEPAYCNRIITYTEMGQFEQAELMFYLARQLKDECSLCSYNMATCLYNQGRYDRAIACLKDVQRLDPAHPQTNIRLGEAHWAKGDLDAARDCFLAELRDHPNDPDTLLDLGEVLMQTGRLEQAQRRFKQALDAGGDLPDAFYCLGELALKRDQLDEAENLFLQALTLDEEFIGVHARLAQIALRRRQILKAARHLTIELKRCGDDPILLQDIGRLLLDARMTHQANKVLNRLVSLSPDDPQAQHNLAVSFFKLRRIDDGILHCRRALNLKPDYSLALYNMALAHLQTGSVRRARHYAWRALRADPQNKDIQQLGKRLGMDSPWTKLRRRLGKIRRRWLHF